MNDTIDEFKAESQAERDLEEQEVEEVEQEKTDTEIEQTKEKEIW